MEHLLTAQICDTLSDDCVPGGPGEIGLEQVASLSEADRKKLLKRGKNKKKGKKSGGKKDEDESEEEEEEELEELVEALEEIESLESGGSGEA